MTDLTQAEINMVESLTAEELATMFIAFAGGDRDQAIQLAAESLAQAIATIKSMRLVFEKLDESAERSVH